MNIETPEGIFEVDPRPLIGGKRINTRVKMKNISPSSGKTIAEFGTCSKKDVADAVRAARSAFAGWGSLTLEQRLAYMQKLKSEVLKEFDSLSAIETLETGKPLSVSEFGPLYFLLALDYYQSRAKEFLSDQEIKTPLMANLAFMPRKNYRVFSPKGVIGVIVPWNFPAVLACMSIVPALIAGNTVVYKPSSRTPFVGAKIAEIMDRVLPKGAINLVQGKGSLVGDALIDSEVDMVVFTGSTKVGSRVAEKCGRNLIPCALELGGLDPMVVLEDADLEEASSGAVFGSFLNSGQICIAAKRVLVHKKVYGEFLSLVKQKAGKLRIGDGFSKNTDIGPLISQKQLVRIERFVADAVARGAKIELGGKRVEREGFFFEPTILTGLKKDMLVLCEEPFGPIMPIIPFDDEDEAVNLANSTMYGLGGSVWAGNMEKAQRLARRLVCGTVWVNEVAIPFVHTPYGGLRKSGILKENAREGIRDLCNETVVSVPLVRAKSRMWWFPFDECTRSAPRELANVIAGKKLSEKPASVARIIKAFLKHRKDG